MSETLSSNDLDDSVLGIMQDKQPEVEPTKRFSMLEVIIDTGATKSVIGEKYLEQVMQTMEEKQRSIISKNQDGKKLDLKFGNGNPTKTIKVIHIPMNILEEMKRLMFYVLAGNVPWLLGMQALVKLGIVINLSLPATKINEKKLNLGETKAGHLIRRLEISTTLQNNESIYKIGPKEGAEEGSTKII